MTLDIPFPLVKSTLATQYSVLLSLLSKIGYPNAKTAFWTIAGVLSIEYVGLVIWCLVLVLALPLAFLNFDLVGLVELNETIDW